MSTLPLPTLGLTELTFSVVGTPMQVGSKRAFTTKAGRAIVVEENDRPKKEWRRAVIDAAVEALDGRTGFGRAPVELWLVFVHPRPKAARKADVWKASKPDWDKLARNVCDALTQSGTIADDSSICVAHVRKRLSSGEGNDLPGVHVKIVPLVA